MLQSIWEDVKREFSYGNMVTRLIIINVAIFVGVNLLWIILRLSNGWQTPPIYDEILHFFMISSDWKHNLTHPWVIITPMFLHEGVWHILWNMLFLYWFGRIVGDFIGNHRILPIYLLGGILGNLLFFIATNVMPGDVEHFALGASAAVMAIVVVSGMIAPDYNIRLLFLGDIKLKYIVAVIIFIDLIGIAQTENTGGHFGHLGGAILGGLFIWQLRQGNDWSLPVNNIIGRISEFFQGFRGGNRNRKGPRVVYRNTTKTRTTRNGNHRESITNDESLSHQEQVDAILDKIKKSGYDSLTDEEKEFLFNASKK